MNEKQLEDFLKIGWTIFVAGLASGLAMAISFRFGISPDELGVRIYVLNFLCNWAEGFVSDTTIVNSCHTWVDRFNFMTILVAILYAIAVAAKLGNVILGLVLYCLGTLVGFVFFGVLLQ